MTFQREHDPLTSGPVAYRRNGKLVCAPCSDSEDRDAPIYRLRPHARCTICREEIE